jgi:membrane protein required for colicin V production
VNGFDLFVIMVVVALLALGAWKGIVRLLLGATGMVAGVFLALRFESRVAPLFLKWVTTQELIARLLAFVSIVVGVSVACVVIAFLVRHMLKVATLGWLDRLLGATAGLLCALLFMGTIAVFLTAGFPDQSKLLAGSKTAPYLVQVSRGIAKAAPPELRQKFEAGLERLETWLGASK